MVKRKVLSIGEIAHISEEIINSIPIERIEKKKRTTVIIETTAREVREAYVRGETSDEMARIHDLFSRKRTTIIVKLYGSEIENVIFEWEQ